MMQAMERARRQRRIGPGTVAAVLAAGSVLIAAGAAQARQLLEDGALTVHVADLGFCEDTVTVELRGPASAFAGDRFPVYRTIAVLAAIVPVECPRAGGMRVIGVAGGQPVWQGRAALPDGTVTELPAPGPQDRLPLDRRDMVAEIQATLNARGYAAGPVDGLIGPTTRSAIRSYQADTGRPVDGAADPGLVRSLRESPAPPPVAAAPDPGADAGKRPLPSADEQPEPEAAAPADPARPARPEPPVAAVPETEDPPAKPLPGDTADTPPKPASASEAPPPAPPVARLLAPLVFEERTVAPGPLARTVLGTLWDLPVAMGENAADGVDLTLPDGGAVTIADCDDWFTARERGGEAATTFDRSMAGFFHRTCDPVVALGNAPSVDAAVLAEAEAPPLDLSAWSPLLAPSLSGERDGKLTAFAEAGRSLADVVDRDSVALEDGSVAFTWQGLRRTIEPLALAQLDDDAALEALVFLSDHAVDGTFRSYRVVSVDRDPATGLYAPD